MFLSQISVSAHPAALANRIRLRGNERGTPLPFNLKMSGCRQHRFSPVGDRSGANQQALAGQASKLHHLLLCCFTWNDWTCGYALPPLSCAKETFAWVERRPGALPTGSCIELSWNGERLLTDGIDPEIDALDDGPATSRSARRIRSEARMPDST